MPHVFKNQTEEHKRDMKSLAEQLMEECGVTPDEIIDCGDYLLEQMTLEELKGEKSSKQHRKEKSSKKNSDKRADSKKSGNGSKASASGKVSKASGKAVPKQKAKDKKSKKKKRNK